MRPAQNSSRSSSVVETRSVVELQRLGDLGDALDQVIDLGRRTVELDDQQGLDVERIAGVNELLRRVDRGLVHHLHAAGDDAGADDARDALAGILGRGKADQHGARGLGFLQDPHGYFGDDAEQPLRAGDNADQVIAARIEMLAAEPDDLAGDQHHLDAEDVVGGHAVFQAMHAAGIFRDIAADRAGDLRRGVRRVIERLVLHRLADGEVGDARLDHGDAVGEIDLADAVELAHAEEHAVDQRQRPAGQRGPRPPRHHPDAVVVAIAQHAGHLVGGFGQHHNHRKLLVGGQPVGFVGPHGGFGRYDPLARHDFGQGRDDLAPSGENGLVGCGHQDGHVLPWAFLLGDPKPVLER